MPTKPRTKAEQQVLCRTMIDLIRRGGSITTISRALKLSKTTTENYWKKLKRGNLIEKHGRSMRVVGQPTGEQISHAVCKTELDKARGLRECYNCKELKTFVVTGMMDRNHNSIRVDATGARWRGHCCAPCYEFLQSVVVKAVRQGRRCRRCKDILPKSHYFYHARCAPNTHGLDITYESAADCGGYADGTGNAVMESISELELVADEAR